MKRDDLDVEVFEMLALLELGGTPLRPPATLRARLLAAAAENGRLRHHAGALATLFDISVEKARATLDGLEAPDGWEEGLMPGMGVIFVAPGPRLAAARVSTNLVRLPAGLAWPAHRHRGGEERHLVLEGAITDSRTARAYGPGDILVSPEGSTHSFQVHEGTPCIGAIALYGEVEFGV